MKFAGILNKIEDNKILNSQAWFERVNKNLIFNVQSIIS